jgi:hypothetical protein
MSTVEDPLLYWRISGNESRVRKVLDLPAYQSLPEVDHRALRVYYRQLKRRLVFPFAAEYSELNEPDRQVIVLALLDPFRHATDLEAGLLCEARREGQPLRIPLAEVKVDPRHANCQLIEDYWYWFWNWRQEPRP